MYCFTNWITSKDDFDGKEPDLPEGVSLINARNPGKGDSEWCLCEISFDDKFDENSIALDHVCDELSILLDSAKGYPPALAIAFHNASFEWPVTKSEYSQLLIELLKQQLRNHCNDNFFLAEATIEDTGYLSKGEFVWLVRFYPETDEALWVSSDFYLYRNAVSDFKISSDRLRKLVVRKQSSAEPGAGEGRS